MGYTGPGKSSTTPLLMGAWQIPGGAIAAEDWKRKMAGWTPAQRQTEGRVGITPQALMDAARAGRMIGMGGYTPEEYGMKAAMMPYATGAESFYDIAGLGKSSADYASKLRGRREMGLQDVIGDLGSKYAARGKYGSGGHFRALQDLITKSAEQGIETDVTLGQKTLLGQRTGGMQEARGRQALLGQMSETYGAAPTMKRMTGLQGLATLPRQYAMSDIDRQYGIWQRNINDLLGTLKQGINLSTGGMGGVSGGGISDKNIGLQLGSWAQALAGKAGMGMLEGAIGTGAKGGGTGMPGYSPSGYGGGGWLGSDWSNISDW